MKKILVLGAGLVCKPGVEYLLKVGFTVTVASRTVEKAEKIVHGHENGMALHLLVEEKETLESLVRKNDIIVSLLPWIHHLKVAQACLKFNKPMATTSYVSDDMRRLDADVRRKNLLFLNEIGIDPGVDHMSAMRIIDAVHAKGGKIRHFYSFCGGLPAPENNDNPFGYKFSWSPRGVVLASRNPARFLENGRVVQVRGEDLFLNKRLETVDPLGEFEVYPNRDSIPYKEIYGLGDARTVMRGTYRNVGWCDTFKKMIDLGLVDESPVSYAGGTSYRKMMADLIGCGENDDVVTLAASKIGLTRDHFVVQNLEWLGLFSSDRLPEAESRLDILSARLLEKLKYRDGEKDMLILRHRFEVENRDSTRKTMTSTLIDYGIPHGDSSMARTVSLPLAVAVTLMAENRIDLTGVQIPIKKEIYDPVLKGIEKLGIRMVEETS
ncbi:saccharopine dehydrogenase [Desulfosarcina alkanivorans]|uniref:Saccharopine dehydrogenase n=1 Tax=Desulfosarcina alkanivorans TaxID=571177 RepID=A0A5K7YVQ0_9BACT|nr:saccharopine dehydrogenase C-terminal domain-containing protein [Desulfosarcina alkanivorans]BBO70384.1 saccharopine dehydrogenase [Desulfosarcina alkanivorans]